MEKVYNKYGLGTLAFVVVVLNLIFPKPNLPMMSINIITCAIILHAYWWLSTHEAEIKYLRLFKQKLVKAGMYHETGQVVYRYTLRGDVDMYFIHDTDLDIWYGLNTRMKQRQFLYPRLAKHIRQFGLNINNLDKDDGQQYTRRSHYITRFDSCEKGKESRVRSKNERLRDEKETQGYDYIDIQKPI